jgi:hypothetical protein
VRCCAAKGAGAVQSQNQEAVLGGDGGGSILPSPYTTPSNGERGEDRTGWNMHPHQVYVLNVEASLLPATRFGEDTFFSPSNASISIAAHCCI